MAETEKEMLKAMVEKLIQVFRKYIFFEEQLFYYLCSIYVLLTHVYDIFDELPYLLIYGPKGTGKSRLGDILGGLCLNPINSSEISTPYVYRAITQFNETTLILDEADDLLSNSKRSGPLLRILRSGYRRTGNVGRCNTNLETVQFYTFCPKILINQSGIADQALESRTIAILMMKSQICLEKFRFSKAKKEFKEIRDLINLFLEECRDMIANRYNSFQGIEGLSDRDEEVWTPILIIAEVLDTVLPEPHIKEDMLKLARKIMLQRKMKQLMENRDAQILESARAYIDEAKPLDSSGLYVGEEIWRFIKDRCGISDLKLETVSRTLNRYNIIKGVKRQRLGIHERNSFITAQRSCYLLDKEKLSKITSEFFDGGTDL